MRGLSYVLLHPRRLLTVVVSVLGALVYAWVAAVRAVPRVRARKAAARARLHEARRAR